MPDTAGPVTGGDRLPRPGDPLYPIEDARLLTGRGRFTTDLVPAGALLAVFLRSPHAHARVVSVDAAAALALPGTVAVLTARETAGLGHTPAVTEVRDAASRRHVAPPRLPISPDRVRHVGEIVAMVVADSLAAAQDAAEAVAVEYKPLPAVVRADDVLAPGAPLLHAEAPGNLCCDFTHGDATAAAFAHAAHVASLRHRRSRRRIERGLPDLGAVGANPGGTPPSVRIAQSVGPTAPPCTRTGRESRPARK